MRRRHSMPFGAEVSGDGSVRFRLWAPAARSVELRLEDGAASLALGAVGEGWFELTTGAARAGSRYRFRIDGGIEVPDPASRFQPADVHGPSEVIDPQAWRWRDAHWRGRRWEEAVIYELHVGSFTPQGSFAAVAGRLDYLARLGVSAIELMPLADFPGARNWGYDGVMAFAPDGRYGRPEDLKELVEQAHERGLMVLLDVVYNHFGPEGNYLHLYAPQFFSARHHTPWGAAINFDGDDSGPVRAFFIHNALYWLEEYHLDGLRLDAVHAIADDSRPDILEELAAAVHDGPGRTRPIHLILENDRNQARYLARDGDGRARVFAAQWNDDLHHALHVLLTGERGGYYADYADRPTQRLGRALAEGFAYQGEPSAYRGGAPRGEPSAHLPPTAFVNFLQNHDQVGNRAFGERLARLAPAEALAAASAIVLLAPGAPLLFMGQEWGSDQPFPFFCDFGPDLARRVTEGRRNEFAAFPQFRDRALRERIPDPNAPDTFAAAVLDWQAGAGEQAQRWLELHRELLAVRRVDIVPRLAGIPGAGARCDTLSLHALAVYWRLGDGSLLTLLANLADESVSIALRPEGRLLYVVPAAAGVPIVSGVLPPWCAAWYLAEAAP